MVARRIVAAPIIAIGGLAYLAGFAAAIGVTLYYDWQFFKELLHGHWGTAIIAIPIISMVAITVVNLLQMPFIGMVHVGERLWFGSDHQQSPIASYESYSGGYDDEYEALTFLEPEFTPNVDVGDRSVHQCSECGKRVVTEKGLSQHMKAKHPPVPDYAS